MAGKKIITVFGATGAQGGAVVDTFLSDPKLKDEWKVRGVTRDVSKESAKKLASKGVDVVAANLDDKESLVKAMTGAATVFAVTNYWEKINMQDEIQQGKNLADAAKETGVQHFIWSSLYDVNKLTNGKLDKVYHFDSKAKVEEYIRSLGIPATFFMPGFYLGNIDAGMLRQMPPDNAWTFALPAPEDAPIPLFHAGDTGKYVKAIVLNRDTLLGERVHASAEYKTPAEIIEEFKKAFPQDGATARFFSVPHEAFLAVIKGNTPAFVGDATKELPDYVPEEMLQNMRLFAEGGYYGGASLEPTLKLVKGVGEKLTTWADYLNISKAFKDLK